MPPRKYRSTVSSVVPSVTSSAAPMGEKPGSQFWQSVMQRCPLIPGGLCRAVSSLLRLRTFKSEMVNWLLVSFAASSSALPCCKAFLPSPHGTPSGLFLRYSSLAQRPQRKTQKIPDPWPKLVCAAPLQANETSDLARILAGAKTYKLWDMYMYNWFS